MRSGSCDVDVFRTHAGELALRGTISASAKLKLVSHVTITDKCLR